jgi:fimbrial chaperone protein
MRIFLSGLAAFAAVAVVSASMATSIQITPTTIAIAHGDTAGSFTLRNGSSSDAALDVHAFGWHNDARGELQLDPTSDILVFPTHVVIPAGETRRVRVGSRIEAGAAERAYRLIVEQTPAPGAATGVSILMRFSLPLFIQPRNRTATVTIKTPSIARGDLRVTLANDSGMHVTPQRITATGRDASGAAVWTRDLRPWYLLAGEARGYSETLTSVECRQTSAVDVEAVVAESPSLTLKQHQAIPAGSCQAP